MAFRKGFYKGWLTEKSLPELRQDIVLNSLFVSDYENRFNISPRQVCDFFDGYVSFLEELIKEDGKMPICKGDTIQDQIEYGNEYDKLMVEYDNTENLKAWYGCFDTNPFTEFEDED